MHDPGYFALPVAGGENLLYRERVYCYELYHQLRVCMEREPFFRYTLHGEVDKKGHPKIADKCGEKIPDFLFHVPGEMDNLAVMEVKPSPAGEGELKDDVEKLLCFMEKAAYHRGILLIYGDGKDEAPASIEIARKLIGQSTILLMWHKGPGTRIEPAN